MANAENRVSTLNGWFKEQYADNPAELIPAQFKLQDKIPFGEVQAQGSQYVLPLVLQYPSGFTFAGPSAGAFSLNAASAGATVKATVQGYQMLLRESIDYESAKLAESSKTSFGQVTGRVVRSMILACRKRLEIEFFYGQMGLGTLAAVSTGTFLGGLTSFTSANSTVATITTGEWAAGVWAGAKGMLLEVRDVTGATLRGNITANAVDLTNRKIQFNEVIGTAGINLQATDVFWFRGAYGNECAGVHKILSNTGTLFGVNAASYELWAGSTYANSGQLTFVSIQKAINAAVEKGLDGDLVALVSHKAWSNLLGNEVSNASTATINGASPSKGRIYDQSYNGGKIVNGGKSLEFYEQNGGVEMIPTPYVKEGYCYLLSKRDWMRVGATDLTFVLPDSEGKKFIRPLSENAGFELRAWSHQAPFCAMPGHSAYISGIVNA